MDCRYSWTKPATKTKHFLTKNNFKFCSVCMHYAKETGNFYCTSSTWVECARKLKLTQAEPSYTQLWESHHDWLYGVNLEKMHTIISLCVSAVLWSSRSWRKKALSKTTQWIQGHQQENRTIEAGRVSSLIANIFINENPAMISLSNTYVYDDVV